MTEDMVIKCSQCKDKFERGVIGNEPTLITCGCGELTIEIRLPDGEEKHMFLLKFKNKDQQPLITFK